MRTATLRREFLMRDRRDTRASRRTAPVRFSYFFFISQPTWFRNHGRPVRPAFRLALLFIFLASCLVRTIVNRNPEKYRVGVSILWHLSFFQHRRFIARDTETPAVYK